MQEIWEIMTNTSCNAAKSWVQIVSQITEQNMDESYNSSLA